MFSFLVASPAPGRRGGGGRSRSRSPARSRSSSTSSSAPAKRSMFSRSPSKPKASAKAPAKPAPAAPAPAASGGGGMMSGLGGMIMQGMAFGGGSAIAHRAVDAVAGPRQVEHVHSGGDNEAAAPAQNAYGDQSLSSQQLCAEEQLQFNKCVQDNSGQLAQCQFYFDVLNQCTKNA